ncbi:alpha/beta fold hydrolase [Rhodococcoides kyotonense]|uniref:Pimeloyl-ACP methyl ester carboxylesterase n=1 Tax=Rhodococcoides kyotonense TaxID=398843 RepID=A0A239ITI3_9NOCA|nr:alpha/beta hydrolase [Rhodococcus kyotonensis]SNS96528.1 Pimeloyl-ACP methyl ester carboxylesterase [Rhodococcus kyotonensis]
MPTLTVGTEELHFEDHGSGRPLVLIHGFPLDGTSWEPQELAFLDAGFRVITYDRRGFGQSSKPATGFDYDTFADDLNALLSYLDLTDVTLIGFSMGTGEIARYLGRYGATRIRSAAMLATLGPQLVASAEDPVGVPAEAFQAIQDNIRRDRFQYLENYFLTHYIAEENLGNRVSAPTLRQNFVVASTAGAYATLHCVDAWQEDFRADLRKIDVPLLVLHGTEDRNIPIDFGARRIPEFVPHAEIVEVVGGPHGIGTTHVEVVNPKLLDFVGK